MSRPTALPRVPRTALGALTGAVGLLGSVRMVATAFGSPLAWLPVLLVMAGWCALTARTADLRRLDRRSAVVLGVPVLVGAVAGWLGTGGAVLALLCSLLGYLVLRTRPVLGQGPGPGNPRRLLHWQPPR